ncbi:hypothetical protein [Halobaculum sp. P14]|uniref:hypothetical protein n=1 Tax=Halobaculum sp. P14 TaxID=3421638 RepID=UPI003EBB18F9
MSTSSPISVDREAGTVTIQNLTIEDDSVAEYLAAQDSDDVEESVSRALRIGVSTMDLVETTKEVEYVERRFETMEREFQDELEELREELDHRFGDDGEVSRLLKGHLGEDGRLVRHLEDTFGEGGRFATRLEDELGEGGEKIQEALNPDEPGTPTHRLKQEIEEVKEKLTEEAAREEVREKTALKGFDFEETVAEILSDIVRQTPSNVEDTSEQTGELSDSKKGDFVVTLGDTKQRIVVEAKNGAFEGTIDSQMTTAIENRDADYGIFVASSVEYLPRTQVGWFSEVDQNYVVVALSEDSDEEIDPRFLKFAYHWARTRSQLSAVDAGDDIDMEAVQSEISGMEEAITDFKKIRTQRTNMESSIETIRDSLSGIEAEFDERVTTIEAELGVI